MNGRTKGAARGTWRTAVLGIGFLAGITAPTHVFAQGSSPLMEANRIYETGDIDGAIEAYDEALRAPGNQTRNILHIHRRLGLLRAAIGDTERARIHFAIAIAMAPDTPASAELSPELREHWEQTRAEQEAIEVRLDPLSNLSRTAESELRVSVLNTPAGTVTSIRVIVRTNDEDPWSTTLSGVGPIDFQLPAAAWNGGQRVQVRVEALDAHGGVIAEYRSSLNTAVIQTVTETRILEVERPTESSPPAEPEPAQASAPPHAVDLAELPEEEPESERSIWASPWLWAITGIVVAGATTTAIILGSSVQPDYDAPTISWATP